MPIPDTVLDDARAWIAQDPDPSTAAELTALVTAAERGEEAAATELADRFSGPLQFGTAGLRGAMAGGENRMNRAVVIRAAAGLAAYLTGGSRPHRPDGARAVVVVGYDARRRSDVFATDTVSVLTGAGVEALLLPAPLPTPVLAYAVRALGADAGVMVTASHNPATDNGYKVYLGGADGGAQVTPPADAGIAAHIAAVTDLDRVARPGSGWRVLGAEVLSDYLDAAAALARPGGPRELSVVLTPLHGVGGAVVVEALRRAGFTDTWVVPEQAEPDGAFPTVAFPNPEEPGALDLALAAARRRGADLVIATDPDADRCAVAVRDPHGPHQSGGWRMLRGDEVGGLLGEHLARRGLPAGSVLACSVVSSRLLARIAAAHGLGHEETLTGFKWIARVPDLAYGYEEALGYCVDPDHVRDKDGVSAAVVVAEMAAQARAAGRTLLDALDDLARAHGVHATDQLSVRVDDLAVIAAAMARARRHPPATLAGSPLREVTDLTAGVAGLPPTDALRWTTAAGDRVVVRPSGTEPKLKAYLEVVLPVTAGEPVRADDTGAAGADALASARRTAAARLAVLRTEVAAVLGL